MKNLIQLSFFLFILLVSNTSQSKEHMPPASGDDDDKIVDLEGTIPTSSGRSMYIVPIKATINSSFLNITVLQNLGTISIEVTSTTGNSLYFSSINTQFQGNLSINVSNWNSGTYKIRFVNSIGEYLQGTFQIE